ncbi:NAD(P)H-hydrate dehydratase [Blautia sp. MSJ-19]|uniref:NAD(P)H-hydrate dehydratase n=1 Tax=Blautia sp. MSJ-19 TaxID=2841517 RepID=UPI001C0EFC5D|nr:NAD(P)H-hydrate dehydratase [Blautia sp. MSJ-19]MBU5481539.1 NAD(P)H-hydrate dehydratase [Blautia sp. MSJ-19]
MKQMVMCREMKALDGNTIEQMGVPSCVLMERAALKVVEQMETRFCSSKQVEKILCVCGSGNNGGDGVAIARILHLHGYDTAIYLLGNPDHRTEELKRQLMIAANYQVPVVNNLEAEEYTTIVDAIFGVGLTRPVQGIYREVIDVLNQKRAWKVAVDIPSGVDGNTGAELGTAFRADLTVTFAFPKAGLWMYPGKKLAGQVVVADVGIYGMQDEQVRQWLLEESDIRQFPAKEPDGNKGTFGKVLVVAGSPGMCGAAFLSASGAFASGAGMVRIVTAEANRIPLQTMLPEAMLTCDSDFQKAFDWGDILVIGPGIGTTEEAAAKVHWFLEAAHHSGKPVVLDADGLNLLAQHPKWKKYLGTHVILTPHIGEMSRLTGKTVSEIQSDRIGAARELASELGTICVLKDACTVISAPGGTVWISPAGNPGMATAGSGDVLSGILAGVEAMFLHSTGEISHGEKAALGVLLHGVAGDLAAGKTGMAGMKAGDIIRGAAEVLKNKQNTEISADGR